MQTRRVVITGLGVISAIGNSIDEFWQSLVNCKPGIAPISEVDTSRIRMLNGAQVKNYDPLKYFGKKQLDIMDRFTQFGIIAAREAIQDANIQWTSESAARTCVILGSSIGGQHTQDSVFKNLYQEHDDYPPLFTIPLIMPNAASSHITILYGITGPTYTISTACSSSNHAIGNAFWLIRSGQCDCAVTGGCESPFSMGFLKAWDALRVVASETCRPFSKDRNGMILGEGGAILILENLDSAIQRKAKIYAEIIGFGMTADASHITRPSQTGAEHAMKHAMTDGNILPEQVDYINTHGTGTLANDPMEVKAIQNVFGAHARSLPVSSTKSMHGHALGATSALEAVATILAMKNQVLPPTANFTEPDPECDIDVVPNQSRQKEIRYALSNAFAFGGLNAVLAFKSWDG